MSESYNQAVAFHYSSYRPPLHEMILGSVLSKEREFNSGLDVGCGTGYSTVALAKYCKHIYGVDPSQSMLQETEPHDKITYHLGSGELLPIPNESVDVVTFAGSLFYAKSERLVKELRRVCRAQALIIPYDFEVLIDNVLLECGIKLKTNESVYDHEINFSDDVNFIELVVGKEQINLATTSTELAHILLSSSHRYEAFVAKYKVSDPFLTLAQDLEKMDNQQRLLKVNTYFSRYHLQG